MIFGFPAQFFIYVLPSFFDLEFGLGLVKQFMVIIYCTDGSVRIGIY